MSLLSSKWLTIGEVLDEADQLLDFEKRERKRDSILKPI